MDSLWRSYPGSHPGSYTGSYPGSYPGSCIANCPANNIGSCPVAPRSTTRVAKKVVRLAAADVDTESPNEINYLSGYARNYPCNDTGNYLESIPGNYPGSYPGSCLASYLGLGPCGYPGGLQSSKK